jgi:hypothetical protein
MNGPQPSLIITESILITMNVLAAKSVSTVIPRSQYLLIQRLLKGSGIFFVILAISGILVLYVLEHKECFLGLVRAFGIGRPVKGRMILVNFLLQDLMV